MDLRGKTVVVTGTFSRPRAELEAELVSKGATIGGSVTKKTHLVFAGEKAGSKASKALELGLPVLGETELFAMLRGEAVALASTGPAASPPAPRTDGCTFSLFERMKAWTELFASRRDVRMRQKLKIGRPTKPAMKHRQYPADAQEFAAQASSFEFGYELKVAPPPAPVTPFGPGPRFALEIEKIVPCERTFGDAWARAGDHFVFASGDDAPCLMACDRDGTALWKTPTTASPLWVVVTDTHAVLCTYDYRDASKTGFEWIDLATGASVGRVAAKAPSYSATAVGNSVFAVLYTPDATESELVVLDGPGAAPRVLTLPKDVFPVVGCNNLAVLGVSSTKTVRALTPTGTLVWEKPGTLHGLGNGELFVSQGDALLTLDPATGAERWRSAGVVQSDSLLGVSSAHGVVVVMTQQPPELRCYDKASGAHRWTASLSEGEGSIALAVPLISRDYVFATDRRYWVRAHSLATGECVDWSDDRCASAFAVGGVLLEDGETVRMALPDCGPNGGLRFYRGRRMDQPPERKPLPAPPPPPAPTGMLHLSLTGAVEGAHLELDGQVYPEDDMIILDADTEGTGLAGWYLLSASGSSEILWDLETMARFPSLTDYLTRGAKRAFSYSPCWQNRDEVPVAKQSLPTSTPLPEIRDALVARGAAPEMADDLLRWLGSDAALLVPKAAPKAKRR